LGAPDRPQVVEDEIRWQLTHMTKEVRAALCALPPVGENRSGPLGLGLLASGQLGAIIRQLQMGLAEPDPRRFGNTSPIPATDHYLPGDPGNSRVALGQVSRSARRGRR
jgi:hypothetical protein